MTNKITGEVSDRINAFLLGEGRGYRRPELPAIIKERFGVSMTRDAVRLREVHLGISREKEKRLYPDPVVKPIAEQVEEDREKRRLKAQLKSANERYQHLLDDFDKAQLELGAAKAIQDHTERFEIVPKPGHSGTTAVAVVALSDWHVDEVVEPRTVNNLNRYNPEVARTRATKLFQGIERLVRKERQDVSIDTLVLWLGGDFISGHIHESLKLTTAMSPIDAAMFARELLESGVNFLLRETDLDLVIPCSVGNHSRITQKVLTGAETGNSLEWFIYGAMANQYAEEKRVRFILNESYSVSVPILGKNVRFHHGHGVKYGGGVGGLTVPLNKWIYRQNQTQKADIDVLGHFHQYMSMRNFVVNGSLIGTTDYGLRQGFENEPPAQAMFLIDQKRGKTISMPIFCT